LAAFLLIAVDVSVDVSVLFELDVGETPLLEGVVAEFF
jgi:hypothetical protein